jgi:putative membrane protein
MDILVNILLWLHIVALVVGGTNSVVMPVIGSKMATATPEVRATLFSMADRLANFGKGAIAVLLITGPLMLWLRYGWTPPSFWFWVKMALIVVMLVGISLAAANGKKAQKGDMAAAGRAKQAGMVTALAFLGVLLSAVFAFG